MDIKEIKNLKIVPENYESATVFEVLDSSSECVKIKLPCAGENELKDYKKGETAEMFGLGQDGLLYFVSDILEIDKNIISIAPPKNYKKIQRRKYSRVPFLGSISLKENSAKLTGEDISAGGLKLVSDTPFSAGGEYEIKIELSNNLTVECTIEPIRIFEKAKTYEVSAKFKKIRSIDRIALMQYSMRIKSETENKG